MITVLKLIEMISKYLRMNVGSTSKKPTDSDQM